MIPACMACGYDLAGLPRDGLCPECGTLVAQSYAPDLLENRSIGFLTQLRSGLAFVVYGLLAQIVLGVLVFLAGLGRGLAVPTVAGSAWFPFFDLLTQVAGLGLSVLVLLGWWRITTPDPARAGTDLDVKPRQIIRVTVVLQAAVQLMSLVPSVLVMTSTSISVSLVNVVIALALVSGLAWVVQFFAVMIYLQWLARRVPDTKLYTDAKRFMWLGPVLYIVGAFCMGIGPLIALILYLVMLFTLRKHLTAILLRLGAL
jgi:hypothetical protein